MPLHQFRHGRATMWGYPAGLYSTHARILGTPLYRGVVTDVLHLALPAGTRVLDVGTGPGLLPARLTAARPDLPIDAVDLNPEMIAQARRTPLPQVTFEVADVAALPFEDDAFPLVVSTISQHHWDDPAAGMREIRRVLAPGGTALVYDFRSALDRAADAARQAGLSVTRRPPRRFSPVARLALR